MKKILTFLMVFVALFTFVACDTGNSSSGNGGNGTSNVETINPDDVAKEFADCTTDVDVAEMDISGGKWTVINIQQSTEGTEGIVALKLQATVADNYFTYTSGTAAQIVNASIMFEEDTEVLEALRNAKNDEEKTAIIIEVMGEELPEGATVTWDGLIGTMTQPLVQEDLDDYSDMQFSSLPEFAVVKCNADKTKYVISITSEDLEGAVPQTYYIEKN